MSIKTYFILTAISCLLFGFSFLLGPELLSSLHGFDIESSYSKLVMRLYGGGLISTGIMGWAVKDSHQSIARKGILLYLFVFDVFNSLLNIVFISEHGAKPINILELVVTVTFGFLALYFWRKE